MATITNMSRRRFLRTSGGAAALVLCAKFAPHPVMAAIRGASAAQPNLFVKVDADGTVTLTCPRSEMGQGVRTGIPMILADELEADWERVRIWQAPGDPEKYDAAGIDGQNTDGSRSTRHHFDVMRRLGASARRVLEQAAAEKWGVEPDRVYAQHHRLYLRDSGESFDYGEVVDVAADIPVPASDAAPPLKSPGDWKYIGRDLPVVDNFDMSTGKAVYGADVSLPNMKIAVVARPPVFRGRLKSYDAEEALKVPGVEKVIEIPALPVDKPVEFRALGGVAVVGTNTWAVNQARSRLQLEWEDGPFAGHDSERYRETLRRSAREGGNVIRRRGDVDAALAEAGQVLEAEYYVPYLAHTPMEPPAALVDATSTPVTVWAPVQAPNETRQYVAEALGIEQADVVCNVTLLGGAFGRKSKPDFVCEAAILSRATGAPVRVQWSREDDVRHGYYHAASAQYLRAGLGADGKVTAWHHSVASPSMLALWNPDLKTLSSLEAGLGLVDLPYNAVPNMRIETGNVDVEIRVGWYRSVNNIQHAFAMNGFANEIAAATRRDPLDVLLELIGKAEVMDLAADGVEEIWNYGDSVDDWPMMPVRLANALEIVAGKSGYGGRLADNEAIGLACHRSFHSYVATAVRVRLGDGGRLTVPRVDVAIDCGRYVNPEGVRKQIEGATVYGHTVARHGYITTKNGAVTQSNFNDYPVSRISDAPLDVRVHLVEDYTHLRPCGVGEPGVPPYAPALANAIHAATGKRLRSLPIRSGDIAS